VASAKRKKKIIMEQVILRSKDKDDFDIKFWRRAGVFARFSATWGMVEDFCRIKGKNGNKLRLQRAVQNIQQV